MQATHTGPWSEETIGDFLDSSRYPMRLACVGADDYPRVVSLWYAHERGRLFCATHRSARLVPLLRRHPKVGFEIAPNDPPYCGVRGQGRAQVAGEGGELLERLLHRYLGGTESSLATWLLSRRADELLITITPERWFSWDYRDRMSGDAS